MLCACAGSSVDQQTNNVSLFNLVDQVRVAPRALTSGRAVVPVEAHAYWRFAHEEVGREIEVRYVMTNEATTLETFSDSVKHRVVTLRMRSRLVGIPLPPVADDYALGVDWRWVDGDRWTREVQIWPMRIREATPRPRVTH